MSSRYHLSSGQKFLVDNFMPHWYNRSNSVDLCYVVTLGQKKSSVDQIQTSFFINEIKTHYHLCKVLL